MAHRLNCLDPRTDVFILRISALIRATSNESRPVIALKHAQRASSIQGKFKLLLRNVAVPVSSVWRSLFLLFARRRNVAVPVSLPLPRFSVSPFLSRLIQNESIKL
jgi:hypothetical protein